MTCSSSRITVQTVGALSVGLLVAALTGCGQGPAAMSEVDPQALTALQHQLLLAAEPDGAQGILDMRLALEGDSHEAHGDSSDTDHDHAEPAEHEPAEHEPADHEHAEPADHEHAEQEHAKETDHDHARDDPAEGHPVVLVGMTPAAAATDAWDPGRAAFTMIDPSYVEEAAHEHAEHEHTDGSECKFCASNKAHAQAIVQFIGDDGRPLAVDARELFGLQGEEIVVVTGYARVTAIGMVVTANGLHVRK